MTRAERMLAHRWKPIALLAFLLALTGAVLLVYVRVQAEAARADQLATEADLRGTAVSTLAGDVRALRQQVEAKGGTPVAPDPAKAVEDLPDRAEVPVPIPGPPGPKGDKGDPGKAAPTVTLARRIGGVRRHGTPGPAGRAGRRLHRPRTPRRAGPQGRHWRAGSGRAILPRRLQLADPRLRPLREGLPTRRRPRPGQQHAHTPTARPARHRSPRHVRPVPEAVTKYVTRPRSPSGGRGRFRASGVRALPVRPRTSTRSQRPAGRADTTRRTQ